jgi:hypothetical protein
LLSDEDLKFKKQVDQQVAGKHHHFWKETDLFDPFQEGEISALRRGEMVGVMDEGPNSCELIDAPMCQGDDQCLNLQTCSEDPDCPSEQVCMPYAYWIHEFCLNRFPMPDGCPDYLEQEYCRTLGGAKNPDAPLPTSWEGIPPGATCGLDIDQDTSYEMFCQQQKFKAIFRDVDAVTTNYVSAMREAHSTLPEGCKRYYNPTNGQWLDMEFRDPEYHLHPSKEAAAAATAAGTAASNSSSKYVYPRSVRSVIQQSGLLVDSDELMGNAKSADMNVCMGRREMTCTVGTVNQTFGKCRPVNCMRSSGPTVGSFTTQYTELQNRDMAAQYESIVNHTEQVYGDLEIPGAGVDYQRDDILREIRYGEFVRRYPDGSCEIIVDKSEKTEQTNAETQHEGWDNANVVTQRIPAHRLFQIWSPAYQTSLQSDEHGKIKLFDAHHDMVIKVHTVEELLATESINASRLHVMLGSGDYVLHRPFNFTSTRVHISGYQNYTEYIRPTDVWASSHYSTYNTPWNLINGAGMGCEWNDEHEGHGCTYTVENSVGMREKAVSVKSPTSGREKERAEGVGIIERADGHDTTRVHDNQASAGTMWQTAGSTVVNEWVIFDLGKEYNLTTAFIWNFNQDKIARYRSVKRLKIYTASEVTGERGGAAKDPNSFCEAGQKEGPNHPYLCSHMQPTKACSNYFWNLCIQNSSHTLTNPAPGHGKMVNFAPSEKDPFHRHTDCAVCRREHETLLKGEYKSDGNDNDGNPIWNTNPNPCFDLEDELRVDAICGVQQNAAADHEGSNGFRTSGLPRTQCSATQPGEKPICADGSEACCCDGDGSCTDGDDDWCCWLKPRPWWGAGEGGDLVDPMLVQPTCEYIDPDICPDACNSEDYCADADDDELEQFRLLPGTGQVDMPPQQIHLEGPATRNVRYIKFDLVSAYGNQMKQYVGLSEVRFGGELAYLPRPRIIAGHNGRVATVPKNFALKLSDVWVSHGVVDGTGGIVVDGTLILYNVTLESNVSYSWDGGSWRAGGVAVYNRGSTYMDLCDLVWDFGGTSVPEGHPMHLAKGASYGTTSFIGLLARRIGVIQATGGMIYNAIANSMDDAHYYQDGHSGIEMHNDHPIPVPTRNQSYDANLTIDQCKFEGDNPSPRMWDELGEQSPWWCNVDPAKKIGGKAQPRFGPSTGVQDGSEGPTYGSHDDSGGGSEGRLPATRSEGGFAGSEIYSSDTFKQNPETYEEDAMQPTLSEATRGRWVYPENWQQKTKLAGTPVTLRWDMGGHYGSFGTSALRLCRVVDGDSIVLCHSDNKRELPIRLAGVAIPEERNCRAYMSDVVEKAFDSPKPGQNPNVAPKPVNLNMGCADSVMKKRAEVQSINSTVY